MQHRIVKDLPGYLRVRFGRFAFGDEQGYGIAEELRRVLGVVSVTATSANGGVLVRYDASYKLCRGRIMEMLSTFDRSDLPVAKASDEQIKREVDSKFTTDLIIKASSFALCRLLLPMPLRNAWTAVRSVRYIVKGLHHLVGKRELSVEVLDAVAIGAAMLNGMFGSAGEVMLLLDISDTLEGYTHSRSKLALKQSLALNIGEVWLVADEGDIPVSADDVREGDLVRVRAGAMVPVDGTVVEGEAALNESSMTGESKLVAKGKDATVFAGTVVDDGNIVVRARRVGGGTRIQNIVKMVDESEKTKAGVQGKAERPADAIVPFNLLAFFGVLAATRNMVKAMSALMVDYSCAIKLSTPVAVMSALREAANLGMVVKGGKYLEAMSAADTIAFDKTGTLTTASPTVEQVISFDGSYSEEELLRISACLEEHFPHSMARAVVNAAGERGIAHDEEAHAEVKYIVAHGIASSLGGKDVVLGSAHYVFEDEGVTPPEDHGRALAEKAPGSSVIYLAIDRKLVGAICISDPLREEAADIVRRLRGSGFCSVVMLTGDSDGAAKAVAERLGITEFRSQILPEDKARIVSELKEQGQTVIMVGDGVNDSPALAEANCSVAMIDASDIAREVADVTLLNSSLGEILTLRELSNCLMARINRNYRAIVAFNTALLVGGAFGLLQPATCALLHNGSTALMTASNMRPLLTDSER